MMTIDECELVENRNDCVYLESLKQSAREDIKELQKEYKKEKERGEKWRIPQYFEIIGKIKYIREKFNIDKNDEESNNRSTMSPL